MSTKRVNVLVYAGVGATGESVRHCLWSFRRMLSPTYAVSTITGEAVIKEPWTASCALFVMPGGADMGYCRTLNGEGNRRISDYVNKGGSYLGLCAGGYYGSGRCEFEADSPRMAVVGDRELAFFPGTCRGLAYPGFVYHSEIGTKVAEIKVDKQFLSNATSDVPESFRSYYNGGGVFVDAANFKDRGVEVLADFTDKVNVDSGEGQAAVVYRKVGDGHVILTSPHPEFAAVNLGEGKGNPDYPSIVAALAADDLPRKQFMAACLSKLGLVVNHNATVPSLSKLHLSASRPEDLADTMQAVQELITTESGKCLIKGENDTFSVEQAGSWSFGALRNALPSTSGADTSADRSKEEETAMIDYDAVVKQLVIHTSDHPKATITPAFNHSTFYSYLDHYHGISKTPKGSFGRTLLYGEVVTSTNTLLEKNPSLLAALPTGLTATATTQLAGRGRGSNVWISPAGCLMFSTVLRHPLSLASSAPVIFVQYILALAIVQGIKTYDRGYSALSVRLKWPNDIYAEDPSSPASDKATAGPLSNAQRARFAKIGGILISTSYSASTPVYTLVCGAGVNVANAAPTLALDQLAAHHGLPPFRAERLLAAILARFEALHAQFCRQGFGPLMPLYNETWLHSGQIVRLEPDVQTSSARYVGGGPAPAEAERCRVKGISADWGLLVVEELVGEEGRERATGRTFELQSDSNSFDFFKGLLKKKV